MYVLIYGCIVSSSTSIYYVAVISAIFLYVSDVVGGIYMFTMFILVLFGSINFVCIPYSFALDDSIFMGFFMYVANPPRVLSALRFSTTAYPSSVGANAPSAIHVSCTHSMSMSSCSSTNNNFR
jgi:membrane glycosyltransferase